MLPLAAVLAIAGAAPADACGDVVAIATHDGTTTRYALAGPARAARPGPPVAVVLLAGGSGLLKLDAGGCARALTGNWLVRSAGLFRNAGFATVLADAPSDHAGADGLAGFRTAPAHAEDLGRIVADLRMRTGGAVWLVGTSRGTISAANAAARLSGPSAPDGVVLTSALLAGDPRARKSWVADSVFDLPLEAIRQPLLVVGHALDGCIRSPAGLMARIVERTMGARQQVVTVEGGPGLADPAGPEACEGRSPHGFLEQEAAVVAGIARFIRGERY